MANYCSSCEKALRDWANNFAKIKGIAAKDKAYRFFVAFSDQIMRDHAHRLMEKDGMKLDVPDSMEDLGGSVTEAPEVVGDDHKPETDFEPYPIPVEPQIENSDTEVLIYGWANNPRLMLGELNDGTKVSVWRAARSYRLPQKFMCRRDLKVGSGEKIYAII